MRAAGNGSGAAPHEASRPDGVPTRTGGRTGGTLPVPTRKAPPPGVDHLGTFSQSPESRHGLASLLHVPPGPTIRPGHSDSETAEDARIERARAEPDHGLASRCLTTRPILRVGGPREAIRALEAAAPGNSHGERTRRRGNYSGARRGLPCRELDVLRLKDSIAGLLSQNVAPARSGDLHINHCARRPSCPPPNIGRPAWRPRRPVTGGATCGVAPC